MLGEPVSKPSYSGSNRGGAKQEPLTLKHALEVRTQHLTKTSQTAPAFVMNRTPFSGRHEATMSVIHGRPVRSLATNREPAVGG